MVRRFLIIFVIIIAITLDVFLSSQLFTDTSAVLCNPGIAFSIPVSLPLIIVGSCILLGGMFWCVGRNLQTLSLTEHLGYGLFLAGGLLNLWERVSVGCVRDVLPLGTTLTNNPADWYLAIGTGLLVVYYVRKDTKNR